MATGKKPVPKWQQLEQIVSRIQQDLAPSAKVRHNHNVLGKSGRRRKLDVTVTQSIGPYSVFIVFDCKRHRRLVAMKDVAAFSVQLEDVSAKLGVMISESGFGAGAKAIASQKNIILQTYRKANETDWRVLLGDSAWIELLRVEAADEQAFVTLASGGSPISIELHETMYDQKGLALTTMRDVFWNAWNHLSNEIGEFSTNWSCVDQRSFIRIDGQLVEAVKFEVRGKLIAKKYIVNLHLAEGDILQDEETESEVYTRLTSKGFDWQYIIDTQQGIELSPQEYLDYIEGSHMVGDITNAKRYLRLTVQKTTVSGAQVL